MIIWHLEKTLCMKMFINIHKCAQLETSYVHETCTGQNIGQSLKMMFMSSTFLITWKNICIHVMGKARIQNQISSNNNNSTVISWAVTKCQALSWVFYMHHWTKRNSHRYVKNVFFSKGLEVIYHEAHSVFVFEEKCVFFPFFLLCFTTLSLYRLYD